MKPRGPTWRIGEGWDTHALVVDRKLILGGVEIAHSHGLAGHSDADALCHAVTDALFGAAALGDIGHHFPPSDPRWKDVSSRHFLLHCAALISEHGYVLANADVTVVCEKPRLAPHIDAMRRNLATDLACPVGDVSVKATTSEKLGFTGRGEGIAAFAIVLLFRPRDPRPVSPDKPELDTLVRRLELDPF